MARAPVHLPEDALIPATGAPLQPLRTIADQAFSRAAGAPLVEGNAVRVLKDAAENYPAWLKAIEAAERHVHFENYIVTDDEIGALFADALLAAARNGVRVRVIYDWLGCLTKASAAYWKRLRDGGVEVRCYNPPRFDSPLAWVSRDHRKMLAVDGRVGFVTGLCVGKPWVGDPAKGIEPWRDTGVEIRGPAVADVEQAFAQTWAMCGPPLPEEDLPAASALHPAGDVGVRIIATVPSTAGMLRLDQMLAAVARKRVWITDAYFAGVTVHVQALRAAAKAGVDVRLLLPDSSDIPLVQQVSRAGYRTLLEAGVRIFEWNGSMLHAKTAVVDGRWSRIGSTNLNVSSWIANCELDALIEDERIGAEMEELYLRDLDYSTEIVLEDWPRRRHGRRRAAGTHRLGSGATNARGSTAVAGALRAGHALGAAFTDRRVLEPAEMRLMLVAGLALLAVAALLIFFPRVLVYPLILLATWFGVALLLRARKLHLERKARRAQGSPPRDRSR